jgi:uncharacterized protein
MDEQEFEWDKEKAARNRRDHGISFQQAVRAFYDHYLVEWIDGRQDYGEERFNLLGVCDGVVLHVSYAERGECIRIISARRAQRHEQEYYYRENSS